MHFFPPRSLSEIPGKTTHFTYLCVCVPTNWRRFLFTMVLTKGCCWRVGENARGDSNFIAAARPPATRTLGVGKPFLLSLACVCENSQSADTYAGQKSAMFPSQSGRPIWQRIHRSFVVHGISSYRLIFLHGKNKTSVFRLLQDSSLMRKSPAFFYLDIC